MKKNHIIKLSQAIMLVFLAGLQFTCAPLARADELDASTNPFTDVNTGSRYFLPIKYLKENGLINGYEDGSFRPLREINRAEALKMLQCAINSNNTSPKNITTEDTKTASPNTTTINDASTNTPDNQSPKNETNDDSSLTNISIKANLNFDDVKTDAWYFPYVLSALEKGIVKGYPDGLFHPEQTINRAESLKIVLEQEGLPLPSTVDFPPYNDVPADAWYSKYAQVAKERTLIVASRPEGNLEPSKKMNRGDFAELIYHTIQSAKNHKFSRATWYSDDIAMQSTASRELYIPTNFTAAHKTLPFGTKVKVTNIANGKSVEVRINDRGPYSTGVDLDLSRSAFENIAPTSAGIIFVEYEVIESATPPNASIPDPDSIPYGF